MTPEIVAELHRVLEIEVQDLELKKNGIQVELFFDTADVLSAVLGMREYIVGEGPMARVDADAFNGTTALVDCLLGAGLLGRIRLLPPHQAEFLAHLERDDVFQRAKEPELPVEEFLHRIGLSLSDAGPRKSLTEMSGPELNRFVKRQAGGAQRLFKAIHCIQYDWWHRLQEWRGGPLNTDPLNIDSTQLVRSLSFPTILAEFQTARPRRADRFMPFSPTSRPATRNNFADAVALTTLLELVRRYRDEGAGLVPRFFDATGLFARVAASAGVEDDLSIRIDDGAKAPVLVSPGYLINRATFRATANEPRTVADDSIDVRELHEKIGDILGDEHRKARLLALEEVKVAKRTLGKVIRDLVECSFLENVWLQRFELQELALRLKVIPEQMASSEFHENVERVIEATKEELTKNAQQYKTLCATWIELHDWLLSLRTRHRDVQKGARSFHALRDLELVRFGLPGHIQEQVGQIIGGLLPNVVDDDELLRQQAWHRLVGACLYGRGDAEKAELAAAILWAMRAYTRIVGLLQPHLGKTGRYSTDLIYAAACFEGRTRLERGRAVLKRLSAECERLSEDGNSADPQLAAQLAIGIAYLFNHFWRARGNQAAWRSRQDPRVPPNPDDDVLIAEAVRFARMARSYAEDALRQSQQPGVDWAMRLTYAVNQHLYYLVEQGISTKKAEMEITARRLEELRIAWPDAWQYTFDDTLARYFHFLARTHSDPAVKCDFLERAFRHAGKAAALAPWDDFVTTFEDQLARELAQLKETTDGRRL